jgi:hypothetical protein
MIKLLLAAVIVLGTVERARLAAAIAPITTANFHQRDRIGAVR